MNIDILANLPHIGFLNSKPNGATNPNWTKNKDKYIGKLPQALPKTYGLFNYFILDLDTKKAKNPSDPTNLEHLLAHLTTIGIDINTFQVLTRSGGMHLYYNQLPFAYANPTGWIKTDYGDIDIRGYSTYVFGPNCSIDNWRKDDGCYAIINDQAPVEFGNTLLTTPLKIDTKVVPIKQNAYHFLSLPSITNGERDKGMFQILSQWYREGKTWQEVQSAYQVLPIEWDESWKEFDLEEKWNYVIKREEEQTINGKEDKLVAAKRDWIYLKMRDEIFNLVNKEAYPRTTFAFGVDNKYEWADDEGNVQNGSLTHIWLAYNKKRVAHTTGWKPDNSDIYTDVSGYIDMVNTYKPLNITIKPNIKYAAFIDQHKQIVANVFMADEDAMQIYYNSIRHQIEDPLHPRTWSATIIGTKGTGKGTLWHTLSRMLPGYGGGGISPDLQLLNKEFNDFLFEKSTVLFDEADTQASNMFTGIRYGALKRYISENSHARTPKGKPTEPFNRPTYFSVEMHANSTNGLKFEQNDRRHFLVHCTSKSLNEIYGKEWLIDYYTTTEDSEAIGALMHHICQIPWHKDWDITHPYQTKWFTDLCLSSKSAMSQDLLEALGEENIYSQSDIHTPASLRLMLIDIKDYPITLSPGKCTRAINELVSDGVFKVVQDRGSSQISLDATSTELKRVHKRNNHKVIAVRNYDYYTSLTDANAAFFSHLPQAK